MVSFFYDFIFHKSEIRTVLLEVGIVLGLLKKTLLKTSKIDVMYSNSLARHFSSIFHAKCLLPRLDRLLLLRRCLQNFYQCTFYEAIIWGKTLKSNLGPCMGNNSFILTRVFRLFIFIFIDRHMLQKNCWILTEIIITLLENSLDYAKGQLISKAFFLWLPLPKNKRNIRQNFVLWS
jgi:hypothetical protein